MTAFKFFRLASRPGLKRSHLSHRKMKKEGEQGSIAKRWSRRTGRNVEGRIEFRGVRQVCPVGGKPGARAKIARRARKGSSESRSSEGLKRATG